MRGDTWSRQKKKFNFSNIWIVTFGKKIKEKRKSQERTEQFSIYRKFSIHCRTFRTLAKQLSRGCWLRMKTEYSITICFCYCLFYDYLKNLIPFMKWIYNYIIPRYNAAHATVYMQFKGHNPVVFIFFTLFVLDLKKK